MKKQEAYAELAAQLIAYNEKLKELKQNFIQITEFTDAHNICAIYYNSDSHELAQSYQTSNFDNLELFVPAQYKIDEGWSASNIECNYKPSDEYYGDDY